jgi:hypothetical protein
MDIYGYGPFSETELGFFLAQFHVPMIDGVSTFTTWHLKLIKTLFNKKHLTNQNLILAKYAIKFPYSKLQISN